MSERYPMPGEDRYFVDARSGCIAVRDRESTDPDYQGLHSDTKGVVRYWHGLNPVAKCPTCGTPISQGWEVAAVDFEAAHRLCDELNGKAKSSVPADLQRERDERDRT